MTMTYEKVAVFTCDECREKTFVTMGKCRPEGWFTVQFCSEKCANDWMAKTVAVIDNTVTFGDKDFPLVIRNAGTVLEFRLNSSGHIRTARLGSDDVQSLISHLFNWLTKNAR